jgi:hypothetical protein
MCFSEDSSYIRAILHSGICIIAGPVSYFRNESIIIIIIINNCKWVCNWWQWCYNTQKTQTHTHTQNNTQHIITNTVTQNFNHNAHKMFQPNKEPKVQESELQHNNRENTEHKKK